MPGHGLPVYPHSFEVKEPGYLINMSSKVTHIGKHPTGILTQIRYTMV